MVAKFDNRRFRTLTDIVIPAGTLVLPQPDGSATATDPSGEVHLKIDDFENGVTEGLMRQLAEDEA